MTTVLEYDKMTSSLQTEFFSVYEKVKEAKDQGDDKKYKSWVDALWKISRVLIDLKNLERSLSGSQTNETEDEFARLLERLQEDSSLSESEKKALMSLKESHSRKVD